MISGGKRQLTTQIEFSGATPLCTIVDGYDPVGNRLTRNLDGNPITWTYDDLYRLTGQAKAGQVCTYTLDGVGNLKTMWEGGNFPRTFTFNAADRLVTMVEGASLTTYAWTGYGALESEITGNSTTGYAYNGQDQLAVVTDPSGDKTTYSFDGDGLRRSVATTNQSQDPPTLDVTTMVWDGSDYLLLSEPTQNRVVLTLDSEIVSCGSKDLLTDPLGSLVKEISAGASLGGLVQLTPYGTLLPTSGKVSIPFVYIAAYGYYNDTPDRDYVRARELYKKLGRWMQTDPLWPTYGANTYCSSNPATFIDPSGFEIVNCPPQLTGQLQKLCDKLKALNQTQIDRINACVKNSAMKIGINCSPITDKRAKCIRAFCTKSNIICYDCCPGAPDDHCGVTEDFTGPFESEVPLPQIVICLDTISSPGCSHWLSELIHNPLSVTLHELMHACGIGHNNSDANRQCNDIYACCMLKVLNNEDESRCWKTIK